MLIIEEYTPLIKSDKLRFLIISHLLWEFRVKFKLYTMISVVQLVYVSLCAYDTGHACCVAAYNRGGRCHIVNTHNGTATLSTLTPVAENRARIHR